FMEFDLIGIRRGNFIIDKKDMLVYFHNVPNLVIIFTNDSRTNKTLNSTSIVMSLYYDTFDDVFKMHFTNRDEGYKKEITAQFKEEIVSQIRNYFIDKMNRKYYINIEENKDGISLVK